jgi:hypothetical protein
VFIRASRDLESFYSVPSRWLSRSLTAFASASLSASDSGWRVEVGEVLEEVAFEMAGDYFDALLY